MFIYKKQGVFISLVVILNIAACSANNPLSDESDGLSGVITLLEINDLHAHLTAHTDIERADSGTTRVVYRGGLARIATVINQVREENPQTLVMNIGDTYHGGVEAAYTQGNAMVAPVNALGIDVGVPGNWDFAYGPSVTRMRYTDTLDNINSGANAIEKPNFPNLAANVTYTEPRHRAGQPFLAPTMIKQFGDIRVGLIGLTSDIVPRMHTFLATGLDFTQGEAAYKALVEKHANTLREQGVHLVVLMSELGIHKDYQLANQLSSGTVDVIFSAHTHELTVAPLVSTGGIWVVEPGNDTTIGRLDVSFDRGEITDKQWQIINIDSTIAETPSVKKQVEEARAPFLLASLSDPIRAPNSSLKLTQSIDTVLGVVHAGIDRRHSLINTFNAGYTQMLQNFTGTSVAMSPGFRFDAVVPGTAQQYEDPAVVAGNMTIEDAYRFFPVPFTLSTATVSGKRLTEVLESNLTAVYSPDTFDHSGGWFDGVSGLAMSLDLAGRDHQRVLDLQLTATGRPVLQDDIISIAGCSRPFDQASETTLCSYDGFDAVIPLINESTGEPWNGVDFLIYGVQNHLFPDAITSLITDQNQTALWPEQAFFQPLF